MTKVSELKDLLLDTLIKQVGEGVDKVTKQGEVVHVDADAPILSVAAKVIKDWADEAKDGSAEAAKMDKLGQYLAARRPDLKTPVN